MRKPTRDAKCTIPSFRFVSVPCDVRSIEDPVPAVEPTGVQQRFEVAAAPLLLRQNQILQRCSLRSDGRELSGGRELFGEHSLSHLRL